MSHTLPLSSQMNTTYHPPQPIEAPSYSQPPSPKKHHHFHGVTWDEVLYNPHTDEILKVQNKDFHKLYWKELRSICIQLGVRRNGSNGKDSLKDLLRIAARKNKVDGLYDVNAVVSSRNMNRSRGVKRDRCDLDEVKCFDYYQMVRRDYFETKFKLNTEGIDDNLKREMQEELLFMGRVLDVARDQLKEVHGLDDGRNNNVDDGGLHGNELMTNVSSMGNMTGLEQLDNMEGMDDEEEEEEEDSIVNEIKIESEDV